MVLWRSWMKLPRVPIAIIFEKHSPFTEFIDDSRGEPIREAQCSIHYS